MVRSMLSTSNNMSREHLAPPQHLPARQLEFNQQESERFVGGVYLSSCFPCIEVFVKLFAKKIEGDILKV